MSTCGSVARTGAITIPYVVDGTGEPPRIVFAHGLTGQGAHVRAELRPLVAAGWTLVTFDQRGHAGATPVTDPALYDRDEMGRDLLAILDDLGWERAWIGGGSMGAATSLAAAFAAPERVEGLVQLVPAIWDTPHEQVPMFDVYSAVVRDRGIDAAIELVSEFVRSQGGEPARVEELRAHDGPSLACALASVPRWIEDRAPSKLVDLSFPIVVLGWHGDAIHPFEVAEAFGVHGELLVGDMAEAQRDPESVGRRLLAVLERHRRPLD